MAAKRWTGRVYLGRENGQQRFEWLGRFPTETERDLAVAERRRELDLSERRRNLEASARLLEVELAVPHSKDDQLAALEIENERLRAALRQIAGSAHDALRRSRDD
jgi:hypothetical protein